MKRKERESEKDEFVVKKVGTIDGRQPLWSLKLENKSKKERK